MKVNDWLVPLIGVLGTTGIWQFLQFRQKQKFEESKYKKETSTDTMYRDDLKKRVLKLEDLLEESSREKDEMRTRIEQLIAEVNALRVEVEYLKRENDRLKDRR
jgi:predicted nuclease with TOPRIM domain